MMSSEKITLKSSDGETFEVEKTVALESLIIKYVVEDCEDCAKDGIRLPEVTSTILSKVNEYFKKHVEARSGDKKDDKSTEDDLKTWDADFVKVDRNTLFDLILAADYLEIKSLLDLTCQTVADMIKGKTSEELRKFLNLKITLKSSDGETFKVEETVALESQTIKHALEDDCADTVIADFVKVDQNTLCDLIPIIKHDTVIPLPGVTSKILLKVIEYWKKHVEAKSGDKKDDKSTEDDLKTWDADFVKVNQNILFDLILAANYLEIESLLHRTCQTVADMIKGMTPEEIRKTFNIKKMTPDEEEEHRREYLWAYE